MLTTFISKFDKFMPIDVPFMELGSVSNAIDETNISNGPIQYWSSPNVKDNLNASKITNILHRSPL